MILIILPVKNEEQTIESTAKEIFEYCNKTFEDYEIMFIDDDSKDKTFVKVEDLKNNKIKIMRNRFDRGKGSALKTGFILSNLTYKMQPEDIVVFIDGDGQISPKQIDRLINQLDTQMADVVIGNKRHTYSITKYPPIRKVVSYIYNLMIRMLFDIGYSDTQCGIKVFRKYALDNVIHKVNTKRYAFDLELIIALREMQMFVSDCPVIIKSQINKGSVNLKNIIYTFFDTIIIYIKMKKGFYA